MHVTEGIEECVQHCSMLDKQMSVSAVACGQGSYRLTKQHCERSSYLIRLLQDESSAISTTGLLLYKRTVLAQTQCIETSIKKFRFEAADERAALKALTSQMTTKG